MFAKIKHVAVSYTIMLLFWDNATKMFISLSLCTAGHYRVKVIWEKAYYYGNFHSNKGFPPLFYYFTVVINTPAFCGQGQAD